MPWSIEGPDQSLGLDARNGIEIAIDNSGGNIFGHEIRFDGMNTGCNADVGKAAAAELASDPTIVGVIGPSCSSEARRIAALVQGRFLVMISPSTTAPDMTEPGNPNNHPGYLRTAINDIVQGTAAASMPILSWVFVQLPQLMTAHPIQNNCNRFLWTVSKSWVAKSQRKVW